MSSFVWIPVHMAPREWEGCTVLWRDAPDQPPQIRELPFGFSRVRAHTGTIEVAGRTPDLFHAMEELSNITAERDKLRAALEWVGHVYPGKNRESGGAIVHMTWEEWNALRVALGLKPQDVRGSKP